jgi:hypothetical protein
VPEYLTVEHEIEVIVICEECGRSLNLQEIIQKTNKPIQFICSPCEKCLEDARED